MSGRDLNALWMHRRDDWAPSGGVTERGFGYTEFRDSYGQDCSVQESSVMPHLWVGVDNDRMHLTPEQVRGLIGVLSAWLAENETDEQEADS